MPRLTKARQEAQRQRIIDATVAVIQKNGFAASSMAAIIKQSELSAGAVYGYFASKDELFEAAVEQILVDKLDVLETPLNGHIPAPSEMLPQFFRTTYGDNTDIGISAVQVWGQALSDEKMKKIVQRVFTQFHSALENYLTQWHEQEKTPHAQEKAQEIVQAIIALIQGLLVQHAVLNADIDTLAAALEKILKEVETPILRQHQCEKDAAKN
ncbi:TetR/AcrR family transcriptional regulator [Corynebacterium sp. sy017]|uniref:TetR/AcrR family transcriptional regulator n=1 Tax=unclassified Corynebacterium TaxID=2624378 RepID=UPI001185AA19|nr:MULTISPECIES: TetR/AcrR family transcriptional regulator [unclassified Corynebacterium]MBP3089399.1 TetR/AcrR family transcriptional regulator [Corynebacterium sp. sy017]TSD90913.1 TetR/AcrR family transcriptional regulator [Corynebacterium sp. SY003]